MTSIYDAWADVYDSVYSYVRDDIPFYVEEALAAGDVASKGTEEAISRVDAEMAKAGMSIDEIDVTPFKEATAGVYETLGYGDLKKQVDAVLAGN